MAFTRLGEEEIVRAEREVIVCGGAYHSPQVLMHSGVGPAEVLTAYAIDVLLDQPRSARTSRTTRR